jgi:hypothetical protein
LGADWQSTDPPAFSPVHPFISFGFRGDRSVPRVVLEETGEHHYEFNTMHVSPYRAERDVKLAISCGCLPDTACAKQIPAEQVRTTVWTWDAGLATGGEDIGTVLTTFQECTAFCTINPFCAAARFEMETSGSLLPCKMMQIFSPGESLTTAILVPMQHMCDRVEVGTPSLRQWAVHPLHGNHCGILPQTKGLVFSRGPPQCSALLYHLQMLGIHMPQQWSLLRYPHDTRL